jgi:PIN domain nuclease of toxin-antitoxin system
MRLLLDTHLLIWAAEAMSRVPGRARLLMADPENELYFSASSVWEVAIKHRLGHGSFQLDPHLWRRRLLQNGYREIAITGEHAVATVPLPPIHADPFDRLLVAQAITEGILLLTADRTVARDRLPLRRVPPQQAVDAGGDGGVGREQVGEQRARAGGDDEQVRGRGRAQHGALVGVGVEFLQRAGECLRVPGPLGAGGVGGVLARAGDGQLDHHGRERRDDH